MANKGGRPQDPIWQHFTQVTKDGKKFAKFISCGYELAFRKPDRMKKHWEKCSSDYEKVRV
jgi:hypothetical protein